MAAQTLTLAGKKFVILPESEYRKLRSTSKRNGRSAATKRPSKRRLTAQDRGDIAEARRRLRAVEEGRDRLIAWEQVRDELGLD